jgi:hypothetical protein
LEKGKLFRTVRNLNACGTTAGKKRRGGIEPKSPRARTPEKRTKVSNWMKKKSGGCGSILAISHGSGLVSRARRDRCTGATPVQQQGILCAAANAVLLRMELNGEAEAVRSGFNCETAERILYVPHSMAADEADALVITKAQGIVAEKLRNMDSESAAYVYATTLAKRFAPS